MNLRIESSPTMRKISLDFVSFSDSLTVLQLYSRQEMNPISNHCLTAWLTGLFEKLGHYGLCVQDFEAQVNFYLTNFNLVPTDFLHVDLPDGSKKSVALFAHIDRGEDYVDHHTFFMSTNKTSH